MLEGRVVTGRGMAKLHLKQEYKEFKNATGEDFFEGSMNVVLNKPVLLNESLGHSISTKRRLLWPGYINGSPVWLYRFSHAPLHILELLSAQHLRTLHSLGDDSPITVSISEEYEVPLTIRQEIAWALIWKGRLTWSYHNDRYYFNSRQLAIELGATQHHSETGIFRAFINFFKYIFNRLLSR